MGRQIIGLVRVLVDQIEKNGYQQRAREYEFEDLYKRLTDAEGQAKHWRQARQDAMAAGELMKAEIETLRKQLADAQREASAEHAENEHDVGALQQQIGAAEATIRAQCREIERLQAFVGKVQSVVDGISPATSKLCRICDALAELDAGTEPAPVAEPDDAEGGK